MQYDFMTYEGVDMISSPKLSIVQKKGQVTIPLDIRQKLGIKEGDRVAFVETEVGVLISPQTVVDTEAFERLKHYWNNKALPSTPFCHLH